MKRGDFVVSIHTSDSLTVGEEIAHWIVKHKIMAERLHVDGRQTVRHRASNDFGATFPPAPVASLVLQLCRLDDPPPSGHPLLASRGYLPQGSTDAYSPGDGSQHRCGTPKRARGPGV